MMFVITFWVFLLPSVSCIQDITRSTANGNVKGLIRKSVATGKDVEVFYGIPYAKPPVGNLRFENPQDLDDWAPNVHDATTMQKICHQYEAAHGYVFIHSGKTLSSSEDCLYVNIFVPISDTKTGKAVLVYIHGGSNIVGSANMFDGDELASMGDIIVVLINYRLGALGFLGSGETDFPGNYALMDQIKALKWVQRNIASFGGDPNKVTLVGYDSAGMNNGCLLTSPLATGLFRAVVSLSGAPMGKAAFKTLDKDDPQKEIRKLAEQMKCPTDNLQGMKECLREKPAKDLTLKYPFHKKYMPYPILLGENFPLINSDSHFNAQHYLLSYTTDENFVLASMGVKQWRQVFELLVEHDVVRSDIDVSDIIEFEYTDRRTEETSSGKVNSFSDSLSDAEHKIPSIHTANTLVNAGLDVFLYEWSHKLSSTGGTSTPSAYHGSDQHYLFGVPLRSHDILTFSETDKLMSKLLMESMGNYVNLLIFAPNKILNQRKNLRYNNEKTYLHFNNGNPDIKVSENPLAREVKFWEDYLPPLSEKLKSEKTDL